jgi:hypothetical protein
METEAKGWLCCTPPGLAGAQALAPGSVTVAPGRLGAALDGFFPDAAARARGMVTGCQPSRLVLTIAPYETYLPAVWCALAQRRAMPGFATLAPGLLASPRGWADLAADLRAAFGPLPVTVLLQPGVIAAALPDTALAMLQRLYAAGVRLPPRQMARLAAVHARLPQAEPLAAFSAAAAQGLVRRLAGDLARLAAMPGVAITTPGPLQAAA